MLDPQLQQFIAGTEQFMKHVHMQLMPMQQAIAALQAESILRSEDKKPRVRIEFMSQYGEDRFAWTLLGRKTSGFFIEAGAFDGYHFSVTYALEAMGWNGLLVEALPDRYRDCVLRRPYSKVANAALSPTGVTGDAEFVVMHDQMFSHSLAPDRAIIESQGARTTVKVPRATLNDLLADHQGEIDLVLLDLEGDEVSALNGFDIARFRPRVFIIEDNTGGKNQALIDFMKQHPYQLAARVAINEVYIRNDEKELIETMQWIGRQGY
jgi:FkbM family methyltransferase